MSMLDEESVEQPGYIERSISAPPLSAYAGFQDFLPNGVPSRSNPKIPKVEQNGSNISPVLESHDDSYLLEGFGGLSVLDEDSHLSHMKSFVIDTKPQTPLELLQADFPSTPSAVFASRYGGDDGASQQGHTIDETDELDDVLTGVDQTTLSMPDVYNAEEDESYSQHSTHSNTQGGPARSYSMPSGSSGGNDVTQQQPTYPAYQFQPQQHASHQQQPQGFHPQTPSFQPSYMGGGGYGYQQQQQQQQPMGQNMYPSHFSPQQQQQHQQLGQQSMGYGGAPQGPGGFVMGMQGGGMYPGNMGMAGNGYSGMPQPPCGGYVMHDGTVSMGVLDATGIHQGHGQHQQSNGFYMTGGGMGQQMGGMSAGGGQQQGMYMDPNYYRMGMPGSSGVFLQGQQQPEVAYSNPSSGGDAMTFMPYGQQQQGHGLSSNAPYWASSQQQAGMINQQQSGQYGPQQQMMGNMGRGQQGGQGGGVGRGGGTYLSRTMPQPGQQLSDSGMSINAPPFVHSSPTRGGPGSNGGMSLPIKTAMGSSEFGDGVGGGGGMTAVGSEGPGSTLLSIASPVRDHSGGSSMSDPLSPGGSNMHGGRGVGGDRRGGGRVSSQQHGGQGGGMGGGGRGSGAGVNAGTTRDAVVEDFRNTYGKGRQWEIGDLVGHVVPFCQDQHGSRFIQQRLEVASDADKQVVFDEVLPSAHSLMTDVFGNYVIQKLFEFGTPEQCETLAAMLMGQAVPLAMQMYGCRVIQKALEYVQTPRLISLVGEFEGQQVLRCVHDQNGNHVIQKCIEVVSRVAKESSPDMTEYLSSRIQFIIQAFQGRVKELSMHPYGCRVVQRILEHCTNTQKAPVLEELRKCCRELIQDQYGNYVIQHVMQHGWETDRAILINEVQSRLLDYSQHKFASNVVEKCIQFADRRDRDEMIWTIINVTFDLNNPVDAKTGQCVLENMVRDPYANYVVQKVIDVSNEAQRGAIIRYVRENIVQLRRYTYGKHIIVRLEKVSGEKF